MQSKFQAKLLSLAITYFTETNISQLASQSTARTFYNLAADFLWQQSRNAHNLYTGRSASTLAYSHHGPNGLERACALLKHFKVISDDNMNSLKHALCCQGPERTLQVEMLLNGNHDKDIDEGQDTVITQWQHPKKDSTLELPNFTTEDANLLLSFINKDIDILDSTFGQIVFSAAFSNLGVFATDVTSTQSRLNKQAQAPGDRSAHSPITHPLRADCHLLYQKIMPWQTAHATMHQSTSASAPSNNSCLT